MPITRSAKKALRQSVRRQKRNLAKREAVRRILADIKQRASEKKLPEARALIPQAYQALDKAAKTGVIKKNAAARKKSRLMRMLAKTQ